MYFFIGEVDGYIEEKTGISACTDKNNEVLRKHTKLWDKIKILIKKQVIKNLILIKNT